MVEETKIGLPKNTVAAICYVPFVGWIAAIYIFLTEKDPYLKFHTLQAIIVEIGSWILRTLVIYSVILRPISSLFVILVIILQLFLIVQAYNGKKYLLPKIGEFVEKQLK